MSDGLKLLASIIENGSTVTFGLLERDLFVGNEQEVYDYIVNHRRRHGEFPLIETIEEDCRHRIPDAPEAVDYYLDKVHGRKIYNELREPFGTLRTVMLDRDVDGIRQQVADMSRVLRRRASTQRLQTIGEMTGDVLAAYDAAHRSIGMTGISTGYDYLDRETGGWFNGDLITLVARMGVGKTWLLLHNVKKVLDNNRSVLVVSTEMPLVSISTRFFAMCAGVDPKLARRGLLCRWGERRYREAVERYSGNNSLHLYGADFGGRVQDIDIMIQELNPDFVAIDGMYLLRPNSNRSMNRFERAAEVVDELKAMTLSRHRPVFATTQYSRDAGKGGKKGSLETIGYTDTIGTHSSIVLSVQATQEVNRRYVDEDGKERVRKVSYFRHIELLKGREGEQGAFYSKFNLCPFDFSEADPREIHGERTEAPSLDYME